MKIFVIIGTRPEAIKMMPVYEALRVCSWCTTRLVLTGQHREMAREVLEIFEVTPDFDLDVMELGQTLTGLSTRLWLALSRLVENERPDNILVQGDTTSAMIGGMIGFYSRCRVGHVEAGLRTGDLEAPYPEEFNRRVISLAAHWHFAPTETAAKNLWNEKITGNVHVVGNTVIDAALQVAKKLTPRVAAILRSLPFLSDPSQRVVLVTAHRRENLGPPMQAIAEAVYELSLSHPDAQFVVPVHPNPSVGAILEPVLKDLRNVHLIRPLAYDEMIHVLRTAFLVLTDSGGLQEEAPAFGVPTLVLRNESERMEGVIAGCSKLVGSDKKVITSSAEQLFSDPEIHAQMSNAHNPYGDGRSAQKIAKIIEATS